MKMFLKMAAWLHFSACLAASAAEKDAPRTIEILRGPKDLEFHFENRETQEISKKVSFTTHTNGTSGTNWFTAPIFTTAHIFTLSGGRVVTDEVRIAREITCVVPGHLIGWPELVVMCVRGKDGAEDQISYRLVTHLEPVPLESERH